jgi:hypothetical protein
MENVIKDDKGQIMLLTVFLIIIEVVSFTAILNSMILTANMPTTGLDESKHQIRDLRLMTELEMQKAAYYANTSVEDPENVTQVQDYFYNYVNSYNNTVMKLYAARGASVEILLNNISFNKTTSNLTVNKYHVEWKNHTFESGSLIIPMDENQTQIMKAYGLVYKTVDDNGTNSPGTLNRTRIPVWTILQNPVNSTVPDFYSTISTDDNASSTGTGLVQDRSYSGGPFLIDIDDIDETKRQMILAEAANKSIIVHELNSSFYYEKSVQMVVPPRVAVYPDPPPSEMEGYYKHSDVPYTALDDDEIKNGALTHFDILTIPHEEMDHVAKEVIISIEGWVANGGVLHVQCAGTDTMDYAVEKWAGSRKPWYGFIGINRSESDSNKINRSTMTYIKFLDRNTSSNSIPFNSTYTFNMSPPLSFAGLADPGAPYSPLAQSHNISGISGLLGNHSAGSTTPAFSLRSNGSQVNPGANILGYAAYKNGTPVYLDADITLDGKKDVQLMYIEAPYENGLVTYLAGHNQSGRIGGERLIFETFFAAAMRMSPVTVVSAKNINITIKYNDGKVEFEDTFLVNT